MKREERVGFCKDYITTLLVGKLDGWKTQYDKLSYEGKVETLYDPDWDNGGYGRKYNHYEDSEIVDLDRIHQWIETNELWVEIWEMTHEEEYDTIVEYFLRETPGGIVGSEEFYEYEEGYYENFGSSPDYGFIDTLLYEIFDIFYYESYLDYVERDIHKGVEPHYKNDFLKKICKDKEQMREYKLQLLLMGWYETPTRKENSCEIVKVVETYVDEWNHQYRNLTFQFYYEGYSGTIIWSEDWGTYELYDVDGEGFDLDGGWNETPRHKGVYKILNEKRDLYYDSL